MPHIDLRHWKRHLSAYKLVSMLRSISYNKVPLCLCLTFLSSVFRLFFCCFYSLYSLLFWPYFSSYCLSDPTFPFLLLLYSLYSLLFWPYFSFSSAAARKVKQRHKTAFLSRFHQKVEEIHFKLEKTVKNRYSWLIWSTRFARTSKRHS